MQLSMTPICEVLFLDLYVSDEELERVAKRLRLQIKDDKPFTREGHYRKRICYKMHDNVTIFVYGDIHGET
jgi:hypothetical protein